jgi:asparagine synthase (glutamine-hydrolysing)
MAALFSEMGRRLKHHSWYQEDHFVDNTAGVALGRTSLGIVDRLAQPASVPEAGLMAVMDGELYDYEDQRRALSAEGRVFRSDSHAELVLHGFLANGREFFRDLHGKFAAAIWDIKGRRLILANDRFGMKPLYYAKLQGRLLFASEIKAVLADARVCRQSHLRGIAQFFTFGQLLGEDTFLKGVRLLPAAGWLTYDLAGDRLRLDRYWELVAGRENQRLLDKEVLDRVDEAFGKAVSRCCVGAGRLGLSLSGGLDSRTILAALPPGRSVTTVSMGMDGSIDHWCAAAMARLRGQAHHRCVLGEGFLARFAEHLRQMVWLTDGHYLSQCVVMPTLPIYRDLGIEVLLRGHAGELMHMTKAYNFSLDADALAIRDEAGLRDWLFQHLQAYLLGGTDGKLFAPAHRRQIAQLARESLHSCLRESEGVTPPVRRVWHLFLRQRLRRETALSLVKFGSLVETRLPYLDNELVDILLAAPAELRLGEKIQAHILRRRAPEFLRVVNVNTGARLEAGLLARLLGRARLKVFAKLGVRGYQPYERLGRWLRNELRPEVANILLNERCLGRGLFDPPAVRKVVGDHLDGRRNHTFLLLALMTFELGQRELIDADSGPGRSSMDAADPGPAIEVPAGATGQAVGA